MGGKSQHEEGTGVLLTCLCDSCRGREEKGERNTGDKEGFAVSLDLGRGSLCDLALPLALPETCFLTVTIVPSYCDCGKFPLSISQMPPALGEGVTNGLQVGGDPSKVCLALT